MIIHLTDNYKEEIIFTKDKTKFNKKRNKDYYMYNGPVSFDIEDTSTYDENGNKISFMYLWGLMLNGNKYIGRTWEQFVYLIDRIAEYYDLGENRIMMIYVHFLSHEFSFIKNLFNWVDTFSLDNIRVIRAITDKGVGFACSNALSGYNLAKTAENLVHHNIRKLVGDLDYSLIRTSDTPITEQEYQYLYNDIEIVYDYIEEEIHNYRSINYMPMTSTGKVRQDLRQRTLYETWKNGSVHSNTKYKGIINRLTVEDKEYYDFLRPAFVGGYTHCNALASCEIRENVASWDETSAYPYILLGFKFPMSKGTYMVFKNRQKDLDFLKDKCYVARVKVEDMVSRYTEDYVSYSKVEVIDDTGLVINNGRIHRCKSCYMTVTDVDLSIIQKAYDCKIYYADCYWYRKAYLPKEFKMAVLDYYKGKTSLKGVEGKETEYMHAKGCLNSLYGMCVCSIDKQLYLYDSDNGSFYEDNKDVKEIIGKNNQNKNRTTFYPWGVWCTAYNRARLWNLMMYIMDESNNLDFCYADTDSVKIMNNDKYIDYIKMINENTRKRLELVSEVQKIPFELFEPETIKGKKKLIGEWDFEGVYTKAKFIRAKTYMTMKSYECGFNRKHCPIEFINHNCLFYDDRVDVYEMTVAGCSKSTGMKYLLEKYGEKCWDYFDDGMFIPKEYSGRMINTYLNYEQNGPIIDYTGQHTEYHELSSVHLEPAPYSLGLTGDFVEFCKDIKTIIY